MPARRFPPPWSDFSLCHPSQHFLITIVIQALGANATSLTDWLSLLPCAPSHSQPATCLGAPPHHITIPTTQPFVRCERISSPASRRPGQSKKLEAYFVVIDSTGQDLF